MKKTWKQGVIAALTITAMMTLTACKGETFDPAAYTKACLDASYHAEYEEYAKFLEVSADDAKKDMEQLMNDEVEAEITGITGVTDEQKAQYLDLLVQAKDKAKYTVGEAKETDDGYEVTIEAEPADIYEQFTNGIQAKYQEAADAGTFDDTQIFPIMLSYLQECIDNATYKEKTETTIKVTQDSNDVWQITEDQLLKVDGVLMPGLQ